MVRIYTFFHSRLLSFGLPFSPPGSCAFPISSFFLQSTEMTDYPLASKALPMRLICRNWPLRSACNSPSMLFLVALREHVSIPPAYHIPLETLFQCVSRDGNSMSCTGLQRWLLSFHVGKQVSNKTSVFCEGNNGHVLIPCNRATKETGNQHEYFS